MTRKKMANEKKLLSNEIAINYKLQLSVAFGTDVRFSS